MIDAVTASFLVTLPELFWSRRRARRGDYAGHKRVQLSLAIVLVVTVIAFEVDLRMRAGIIEMVAMSPFAGTHLLNVTIWVHLFVAITTSVIWLGLIGALVVRFANPPPNRFSRVHRGWGIIRMVDMLATGVTGVMLYVLGLALSP
ncbi:MAG: hypothetical protein VYE68_11355 [Acidobacteriota bacterium]|nr:hypothetical protein [Acidobacteriota bacterium]